ncbi:MAG TPA: MarR family transcriptional regulator [Actinocrinis sp.]|jgi:DNA-binding MarR family transcriptional regulator
METPGTGSDAARQSTAPPTVPSTVPSAAAAGLSAAFGGIQRAARRRIRRDLGVEPLSGAQVELLRLVMERPGIGVSGAARELHLAGNSVSTLVNHLVSAGYVVRETDPADRRAVRLTATRHGLERMERWADRRAQLFGEQLALLDPADRELLEAALPAMVRLADALAAAPADRRADTDAAPGPPPGAGPNPMEAR